MPKSKYTNKLLELFAKDGYRAAKPFYYHYPHLQMFRLTKKAFYNSLWQMAESGAVSIFEKNNKRFVKITEKGELELLMQKAKILESKPWDGKWRMVLFDIPEGSRDKRDKLRRILKANGYFKLQASVFISPYSLNQEAVKYLNMTGLTDFIRILRIDKIDNADELIKKFKLTSNHS